MSEWIVFILDFLLLSLVLWQRKKLGSIRLRELSLLKSKHEQAQNSLSGIIFIDYGNHHFKFLDSWLTNETVTDQYVIVLNAPPWLLKIKNTAWKNHYLYESQQLNGAIFTTKNTAFVFKRGKMIRSSNIEMLLSS